MRTTFLCSTLAGFMTLASAASAHHPGEALDDVMTEQEPYFQVIDQPAPGFDLVDGAGAPVSLSDFADKVVVLDFVFASCTDLCPLQSELVADVQEKVNASPMKDMVQFVTVTTDSAADTPEVMAAYGEAHGLDPVNWSFLTARTDDPERVTRDLSATYSNSFTPLEDGQQMHGAVIHVIDRGGRLAGRFHGLDVTPMNMVLYVNGLTNSHPGQEDAAEEGWWSGLTGMLR
jgi:protein SCO1/2